MISDRVLRSAMASKLAYAQDLHSIHKFPVTTLLHGKHVERVSFVNCKRTGAHAYVWHTGDNSKLVSFRGSSNVHDVCRCVNTQMVPFQYCEHSVKIHNVVYDMFASIEDHVARELQLIEGRQNITLCGHSLGGAIASFAAAYFANMTNGRHNIACHTFGAPKVGDIHFTEWFKHWVKESIHLKNKYDIIADFPFWGYTSMPNLYTLDTKEYISKAFMDHDMDTYIYNIINACHHHDPQSR